MATVAKDRPTKGSISSVEPVKVGKRQGWRVAYDGHQKTMVTSASTATAIKDATRVYGSALKRLADK